MTAPDPVAAAESRNPFASPRFLPWWLASLVAGTGVGIQSVTVPLFIRDRVGVDERAIAIAAALIAHSLPGALLTLFGGALADRVERGRILARTYGTVAVVSVAYVFLSGFDVRLIWPVFVLGAIVGSSTAFTNPARQSMLPQLVSPAQLQNGVILGTMGFMATLQFLGPTVAGLLAEASGLTLAFALEVVMLSAAAVLFSRVPTDLPEPSGRSVAADLLEGLHYIRARPELLWLLVMATLPGVFFMGSFSVTVPIVVPDILHAGDKWVGILWGCFGGGVFVSSILLTLFRLRRRGLAICLSMVAGGLILTAYGLSETLSISTVLLFVWGAGAAVFINYVVALLQENTEPRMMGRVMSMYSLAFFISAPVGYLQAGIVTSVFGPKATLLSSGVVSGLLGVAFLVLLKPVRDLK